MEKVYEGTLAKELKKNLTRSKMFYVWVENIFNDSSLISKVSTIIIKLLTV